MRGSSAGSPRETSPTCDARTIEHMTDESSPAADPVGAGNANVDEFYIRRINWLVTVGRPDLIDEIADDYERRCTTTTFSIAQSGHILSDR